MRLRHKKTNFGKLADPFDVSLTFSDEMIVATTRELVPADLAQEITLSAEERAIAALEDGPAYPDEIAEATGLARSTVKNKINVLKKAGRVKITGAVRGQMEEVRLADLADLPYKGKSAKSATDEGRAKVLRLVSSSTHPRGNDSDDTSEKTVASLFADPPDWLPGQLEVYRQNPAQHIKPLCAAVAAVVLGDGARGDEVREEVEKALG